MSTSSEQKWLITGANGNLGKRLIRFLAESRGHSVVAVVRSQRARQQIEALALGGSAADRLSVEVLDYSDADALRGAAQGCTAVVHLVGILKATANASYEEAHETSCRALVAALAGTSVAHLTYLSIVGSRPDAANACLASKGRAEQICLAGSVPCCVLRVPMVIGEGDYASFALGKRASKPVSFSFRSASLEQPIYAGDVVQAVYQAGTTGVEGELDLGGPEMLTRKALTARAGAILNASPTLISLPLWLGLTMAGLMEAVLANPPVTRAMLEVLDHDDQVDPQAALDALQIGALTPLDDALRAVLG